jgi:hypothetical protein
VADDRNDGLEQRRRLLIERADELAAQLVRLASGERATARDLQQAKEVLAAAMRHSAHAHDRAAAAYRRAAIAHRRVAESAHQAGDHARAEAHLAAAKADDEAAQLHARAAETDRASLDDKPSDQPRPA